MPTNLDIITNVFAETAKQNGRPFLEAMADDCIFRGIGSTTWTGPFEGKQTTIDKVFAPLRLQIEGGRTRTIPTRIYDAGDVIIVEANGQNTTTKGEAYNNTYCFVIRMKDGKMVDITEYSDTALIDRVLTPPDPAN